MIQHAPGEESRRTAWGLLQGQSSDSDAIVKIAGELGDERILPVQRPAKWATDTASTEDALLDFAQKFEFDRAVLVRSFRPPAH